MKTKIKFLLSLLFFIVCISSVSAYTTTLSNKAPIVGTPEQPTGTGGNAGTGVFDDFHGGSLQSTVENWTGTTVSEVYVDASGTTAGL